MAFGPHLLLAILEGLVSSAVLALTALGLSLVFGVMRVVNIAHGELFMLGAVLAWAITNAIGGSPALGFLAALVIAPLIVGAVALVAERLVLRRLNYEPHRGYGAGMRKMLDTMAAAKKELTALEAQPSGRLLIGMPPSV